MPQSLQYINADFAAQREALIARIRSEYPGRWNDFSASNFGQMLLELQAYGFSTMGYTLNRLAGEQFLSTAQLRESIARLGALTGYTLRNAAPSTVKTSALLPSPAASQVRLARGTQIRTGDATALPFELSQDYTIEAGQTSPIRTVLVFDPAQSGPGKVQALLSFTAGLTTVDCLDATVDLVDLCEAGQVIVALGTEAEIAALVPPPGGVSNSRFQLTVPWAGATATTAATVIDRRVDFVQGVSQQDVINLPASGLSGYYFALSQSPAIGNLAGVLVNSDVWTQVDLLVNAGRDQPVYAVTTLPNGTSVVQFGNGQFGRVPPGGALVQADYRTGGGAVGNVAPGAISTSIIGLITATSNPVTVRITNSHAGSGGLDAETSEEARTRIPAFTRAGGQAVTLENYETIAMSFVDGRFGAVRYARANVRRSEGNIVYIYAWTTGTSGALLRLNSSFKQALAEYVQARAVGTDYVVVEDGDEFALPYAARFQASPGYSVDALEALLIDRLTSYVTGLTPGSRIQYGDVFSQLVDVPGVDNLVVATPVSDIPPPTPQAVFVPPIDSRSEYELAVAANSALEYECQSPVVPLAPWCFELSLDGSTVSSSPGAVPGTAVLSGAGLSASSVNLATGKITFVTTRQFSSAALVLRCIQGYSEERRVDIYATVVGEVSLSKRREIRTVLRAWVELQAVGASLYAEEAAVGRVTAKEVILAVDGITDVSRVSFDAPSSAAYRIDAASSARLVSGTVSVNGYTD